MKVTQIIRNHQRKCA